MEDKNSTAMEKFSGPEIKLGEKCVVTEDADLDSIRRPRRDLVNVFFSAFLLLAIVAGAITNNSPDPAGLPSKLVVVNSCLPTQTPPPASMRLLEHQYLNGMPPYYYPPTPTPLRYWDGP
jgi:hypothetical protein